MDPAKARRHIPEPFMFTYSSKDAILYALGVGANTAENLHFVYEGHNDFQVFPTFAVVPGILANPLTDLPGIQFDLSRVLHGEQYIELFAPFPPDGTQLRSEMRVADVLDKGTNALIITEVTTFDDRTNEKLSFQQFGIIQGGAGGFGGNRTSPAERKVPPVPQGRAPDAVLEDKTRLDQAALYRLGSNDLNPLHIDANFAKMAGFQRPILHGLCTLGISCRLILQAFGQGLAKNLRSVKVRFSAPVEPGQTLVVEMWRHDAGGVGDEKNMNGTGPNGNANNNRVLFQTKVKETGKVVLSNGCVELRELSVNDGILPHQVVAAEQLKAAEVFRTIGAELQKNSDKLRNIEDAVILYEITTGGQVAGKYTVELKAGEGHVYEGMPRGGQNAVATVRVDDADFVKLVGGQLDATRMIGDDVDDDDAESDDDETEHKFGGLFGWLWTLLETMAGAQLRLRRMLSLQAPPPSEEAFLSGRLKVKGKLALLQRIDALLRKTRNAQRSKL